MSTSKLHPGRAAVACLALCLTSLPILVSACGGTATSGGDGVPTVTETSAMSGHDMSGMSHSAMPAMTMRQVAETTWQGMRIAVALTSPPVSFSVWNGTRQVPVEPKRSQNVHLMVVLSDAQTGERIPYASVEATLRDGAGRIVYAARQWPMLSRSMGVHYGNNVDLPHPGRYSIELQVGPPAVGRHPEYQKVWLVPHTVRLTFRWKGQL
jgi:hypothetical protein